MKPGRIAAWVISATALPVLAALLGRQFQRERSRRRHTTGGNQPATSAPAQPSSQSPAAAAKTGAGGLTPPGTHLGFGKDAIVGWVPPSDNGTGAHKGIKLQVTVESIQKGTLADFRNVNLDAKEKKDTPYYVTLRITELQNAPVPQDSDPAITFTAIDDRGQQAAEHHLPRDVPAVRRPVAAQVVREREVVPGLRGLPDPGRRLDPVGPVGQRAVPGERRDPLLRQAHRVGRLTVA